MDKEHLKNIILAVAHQILSTCSQDQLENALAAFILGDPVTLKPYKPIHLDDYDFVAQKIKRALTYRPRRMAKSDPKPSQFQPSIFPDVFTLRVPLKMDISQLSNMERQILYHNLDKVLLMTVHQPNRSKNKCEAWARIGIPIRHLNADQKKFVKAEEDYITEKPNIFYKTEVFMAYFIFMPKIIGHSFKKHIQRDIFFGIPP